MGSIDPRATHPEQDAVATVAEDMKAFVSMAAEGASPARGQGSREQKEMLLMQMRTMPLFRCLTGKELQSLVKLSGVVSLPPSHLVCRQGEEDFAMLIVLSGSLNVYKDPKGKGVPESVLGEGCAMSETCALLGEPKKWTVRTGTIGAVIGVVTPVAIVQTVHQHAEALAADLLQEGKVEVVSEDSGEASPAPKPSTKGSQHSPSFPEGTPVQSPSQHEGLSVDAPDTSADAPSEVPVRGSSQPADAHTKPAEDRQQVPAHEATPAASSAGASTENVGTSPSVSTAQPMKAVVQARVSPWQALSAAYHKDPPPAAGSPQAVSPPLSLSKSARGSSPAPQWKQAPTHAAGSPVRQALNTSPNPFSHLAMAFGPDRASPPAASSLRGFGAASASAGPVPIDTKQHPEQHRQHLSAMPYNQRPAVSPGQHLSDMPHSRGQSVSPGQLASTQPNVSARSGADFRGSPIEDPFYGQEPSGHGALDSASGRVNAPPDLRRPQHLSTQLPNYIGAQANSAQMYRVGDNILASGVLGRLEQTAADRLQQQAEELLRQHRTLDQEAERQKAEELLRQHRKFDQETERQRAYDFRSPSSFGGGPQPAPQPARQEPYMQMLYTALTLLQQQQSPHPAQSPLQQPNCAHVSFAPPHVEHPSPQFPQGHEQVLRAALQVLQQGLSRQAHQSSPPGRSAGGAAERKTPIVLLQKELQDDEDNARQLVERAENEKEKREVESAFLYIEEEAKRAAAAKCAAGEHQGEQAGASGRGPNEAIIMQHGREVSFERGCPDDRSKMPRENSVVARSAHRAYLKRVLEERALGMDGWKLVKLRRSYVGMSTMTKDDALVSLRDGAFYRVLHGGFSQWCAHLKEMREGRNRALLKDEIQSLRDMIDRANDEKEELKTEIRVLKGAVKVVTGDSECLSKELQQRSEALESVFVLHSKKLDEIAALQARCQLLEEARQKSLILLEATNGRLHKHFSQPFLSLSPPSTQGLIQQAISVGDAVEEAQNMAAQTRSVQAHSNQHNPQVLFPAPTQTLAPASRDTEAQPPPTAFFPVEAVAYTPPTLQNTRPVAHLEQTNAPPSQPNTRASQMPLEAQQALEEPRDQRPLVGVPSWPAQELQSTRQASDASHPGEQGGMYSATQQASVHNPFVSGLPFNSCGPSPSHPAEAIRSRMAGSLHPVSAPTVPASMLPGDSSAHSRDASTGALAGSAFVPHTRASSSTSHQGHSPANLFAGSVASQGTHGASPASTLDKTASSQRAQVRSHGTRPNNTPEQFKVGVRVPRTPKDVGISALPSYSSSPPVPSLNSSVQRTSDSPESSGEVYAARRPLPTQSIGHVPSLGRGVDQAATTFSVRAPVFPDALQAPRQQQQGLQPLEVMNQHHDEQQHRQQPEPQGRSGAKPLYEPNEANLHVQEATPWPRNQEQHQAANAQPLSGARHTAIGRAFGMQGKEREPPRRKNFFWSCFPRRSGAKDGHAHRQERHEASRGGVREGGGLAEVGRIDNGEKDPVIRKVGSQDQNGQAVEIQGACDGPHDAAAPAVEVTDLLAERHEKTARVVEGGGTEREKGKYRDVAAFTHPPGNVVPGRADGMREVLQDAAALADEGSHRVAVHQQKMALGPEEGEGYEHEEVKGNAMAAFACLPRNVEPDRDDGVRQVQGSAEPSEPEIPRSPSGDGDALFQEGASDGKLHPLLEILREERVKESLWLEQIAFRHALLGERTGVQSTEQEESQATGNAPGAEMHRDLPAATVGGAPPPATRSFTGILPTAACKGRRAWNKPEHESVELRHPITRISPDVYRSLFPASPLPLSF